MSEIHATAIIGPDVTLGNDVSIGPYAVLDGTITLGDECVVGPHCHITGHTDIGARTRIHAGAVVGDEPQDHAYEGADSRTVIGTDCVLREYVTIHRATDEGGVTLVGDHCMFMSFAHVAHNCRIGNQVNIANMSMLAGHVHVGDRAFISADVGVHQFVHIGAMAMVTGKARVSMDIPPYCLLGEHDEVYGPNIVGLRRAGFKVDLRNAVKAAIRTYYFSGLMQEEALARITHEHGHLPEIAAFVQFIRDSKRGIIKGRRKADPGGDPSPQ